MKITKVAYQQGMAAFVIDGDTTHTYCISLIGKTTVKEVTDALKEKVNPEDKELTTYKNLNLESLGGSDI